MGLTRSSVPGLFTAGELLDETLGSAADFANEGYGRVIVGRPGQFLELVRHRRIVFPWAGPATLRVGV
jgi:hypothetical protein